MISFNRTVKQTFLFACLFFSYTSISAQEILSQFYQPKSAQSISEIIDQLEEEYQLSFSYNTNIFNDYVVPDLDNVNSLESLFNSIFTLQKINYEFESFNKVLLYKVVPREVRLTGLIRDGSSKETVPGAVITIKEINKVVSSTEEGQFFFKASGVDSLTCVFRALAYKDTTIVFRKGESSTVVELSFQNQFAPIIILPQRDTIATTGFTGAEHEFTEQDIENSISIFGEFDALERVKNLPEVHVGSEAQNGFVVKGGSPDQNLILMDGMPVYDVSHIGGVSSIFLKPAIKSIKLHTTGFPSEYGGRLSSVMDVNINEGNTVDYKITAGVGITGANFHSEGPLVKEKMALSLSGRISWLGVIAQPIFERVLNYNDTGLNFYDFYAKWHYKFSPTNRLSISYYKGKDDISLTSERLTESGVFSEILNRDINSLNWGNEVIAAKYTNTVSDNIFIKATAGRSTYRYSGTGIYNQINRNNSTIEERRVEIQTNSVIQDYQAKLILDIYQNLVGKLRVGTGYIAHEFKPSLTERLFINGAEDSSSPPSDNIIIAQEFFAFAEQKFSLSKILSATIGLHINQFSIEDISYLNLEPRLNLNFDLGESYLKIGASDMHQNIHLLVNPGPGLPSDLWVPSGQNIAPSKARELSFNFSNKSFKSLTFGFLGYYKWLTEVKEYQATSDIYYALLSQAPIIGNIEKETDWRDRIISGKGRSFGVGSFLQLSIGNLDWSVNYLFARALLQFDEIDAGNEFPSRFDRKHNLQFQMVHSINERFKWSLSGTFGNGYRYTIPVERFPSSGGPVVWVPPTRNNAKLPDYHHLDLNVNYSLPIKSGKIDFMLGAYNVYNRYNPFYTYIVENADATYDLVQLSVFPIIPHLNIVYTNR